MISTCELKNPKGNSKLEQSYSNVCVKIRAKIFNVGKQQCCIAKS